MSSSTGYVLLYEVRAGVITHNAITRARSRDHMRDETEAIHSCPQVIHSLIPNQNGMNVRLPFVGELCKNGVMRLARYLQRNKLSQEAFAALAGLHPTTIYRFVNGLAFPKSSNLRKISEVTNGLVKANDFMDVVRPPAAPGGRGRPRKPEGSEGDRPDGPQQEGGREHAPELGDGRAGD
jgi:transcriptional regulator with XRE-family HTH domain